MLPRAGASECSACPAGTSKGAGDGPCKPCDDGEYAPVDGSSSCRTCSWPLATLENSSSTSCDACVENYYWSAADDAVCAEEQCPEFCSACLGQRWIRNRVASTPRLQSGLSAGGRRLFISKNQPTRAQARTATTVRTPASPSLLSRSRSATGARRRRRPRSTRAPSKTIAAAEVATATRSAGGTPPATAGGSNKNGVASTPRIQARSSV